MGTEDYCRTQQAELSCWCPFEGLWGRCFCASPCTCVCVSHLSRGQLSPSAVREASVMLLQPDTQRICSLWHPRHRLTRPSSVICWRQQTYKTNYKNTETHRHIPHTLLAVSSSSHPTTKYLSYCAWLHIDGGEFWAVFLKVFQCSIIQLRLR